MHPDDVFVTGMAWSTPLGDSIDEVWSALLAGRSALRELPSGHALRTELAATVPGVCAAWPARDRQRTLTERTLDAAFADAGLEPDDRGARIVAGTSFGAHLDEPGDELDAWAVDAAEAIGHARRPLVVSTACSAGADSILIGAELVRTGAAETCVAGGADVVTAAKRLGHSALGTLSRGRLLAFDRRRDGMVPGEGAAFLVLESARSVGRRGARVDAVLRGAGASNDAAGLTAPDPSGTSVALAVRRCLAAARRRAGDVAVVSAHATGTALNDEAESASLRRVFGDRRGHPVVFATKGALGHSLGATGAIEAVTLVLALRDGRVPPVAGLRDPLDDFPLRLAAGAATSFTGATGLTLTMGFGGFNTCLLFERP